MQHKKRGYTPHQNCTVSTALVNIRKEVNRRINFNNKNTQQQIKGIRYKIKPQTTKAMKKLKQRAERATSNIN